jgi:arsenate reductase
MKVYFNPRCSKCRIARTFLEDNNFKFELIEYLDSGINKEDIKNILKNGKLNILDILRKNEEEYKVYIKNKELSKDEIINVLCKYPKLLQRPIIFDSKNAMIARDEESLNELNNLF